MLDWDSHRYLECFFAVPMMGAVLHTVNVRLSPEQIVYTINHAEDDVLLVNAEFLPVLEQIRDRLDDGARSSCCSATSTEPPATTVPLAGEYEALLAQAPPAYDFPDFDEDTCATTFYTTGTTGLPKGVYFSHRQLVLHTLGGLTAMAMAPTQGGFHADDVYMPITPMFHVHAWGIPYMATLMGVKQVYPGRYDPAALLGPHRQGEGHLLPLRAHHHAHAAAQRGHGHRRPSRLEGHHRRRGPAQGHLQGRRSRGIDIYTGYGMSARPAPSSPWPSSTRR